MLDVVVLRLGSGMGASRKPCGEALRTLETVKVALNMCVCIHAGETGGAFVADIFGGKRISTCWH